MAKKSRLTAEEASEWELEHFGSCSGPVKSNEPEWQDWTQAYVPSDEWNEENYVQDLLRWLLDLGHPEQTESFLKWWVDSSPVSEEPREIFLKSLESCSEHIRESYLEWPSTWLPVCPEEHRENFLKWARSEQRKKLLKWMKRLAAKKDLKPGMRRLVDDLFALRAGRRSYDEVLARIRKEQKQELVELLLAKIGALPPEKKQQVEDLVKRCNGDAFKFLRHVKAIVFPPRRRGRPKGPAPEEQADRRMTLCACIDYCLRHRDCLRRRGGATGVYKALAEQFGVSTWAIKKRLGVSPKALMKRFRESNQYRVGLYMMEDPDRPPSFNALGAAIPTFVGKVILSDWDPTLGPNPYDKPEPEPEESLLERAFNFLDEDKTWRTADLAEHYSVKPASIRMRRYRYKRVIRKAPIPF